MADSKFDLSVVLKLVDKMSAPMNKLSRKIDESSRKLSGFNNAFKRVQKTAQLSAKRISAAGKAMGLALSGFGVLSLRSALTFSKSMQLVKAKVKITGKSFEELQGLAKKLGKETSFSASQAAEGMTFLAQAGLNSTEIYEAMPKVLELASGASLGLADASNIVTNIMSGMGLEIKDLAKVNDVLVNVVNNSNTDLLQLGEAFKNVGPVAKALGFDFKDVAASLAVLADTGLSGGDAGTKLKNALKHVVAPTEKARKVLKSLGISFDGLAGSTDSSGAAIVEHFEKLKESAKAAGRDTTKIQSALGSAIFAIFGQQGAAAVLPLLGKGSKKVKEFRKSLDEEGTSSKAAKTLTEGLSGAWNDLKSAIEGVQLALTTGKTGELLEKATRDVVEIVRAIASFGEENNALISSKLVKWLETLAPIIEGMKEGFKGAKEAAKTAFKVLSDLFPEDSAKDFLELAGGLKGIGDGLAKIIAINAAGGLTALAVGLAAAFAPITIAGFAIIKLLSLIKQMKEAAKLKETKEKEAVERATTSQKNLVARRNELVDQYGYYRPGGATTGERATIARLDEQINASKPQSAVQGFFDSLGSHLKKLASGGAANRKALFSSLTPVGTPGREEALNAPGVGLFGQGGVSEVLGDIKKMEALLTINVNDPNNMISTNVKTNGFQPKNPPTGSNVTVEKGQ